MTGATVFVALLWFGANLFADYTAREAIIVERITPNIEVVTESTVVVAENNSGDFDVLTTYNTYCSSCHLVGVAGAPILGDEAAWAPRIAQGNEVLYEHAINGINGMPAKGLCMSCTDDQIKELVDYMVSESS